jgi:hypothetical protein
VFALAHDPGNSQAMQLLASSMVALKETILKLDASNTVFPVFSKFFKPSHLQF